MFFSIRVQDTKLLVWTGVHTSVSKRVFRKRGLIAQSWLFQAEFAHLSTLSFLLCYSGLCTGRPAGWFGDVCQEATRYGPASQPDGGGRPAPRLPQPSAALQGDGGGFWHLYKANKEGFPQGQSGACASATSKPGRHLYEQQFISLTQLCRFSWGETKTWHYAVKKRKKKSAINSCRNSWGLSLK